MSWTLDCSGPALGELRGEVGLRRRHSRARPQPVQGGAHLAPTGVRCVARPRVRREAAEADGPAGRVAAERRCPAPVRPGTDVDCRREQGHSSSDFPDSPVSTQTWWSASVGVPEGELLSARPPLDGHFFPCFLRCSADLFTNSGLKPPRTVMTSPSSPSS